MSTNIEATLADAKRALDRGDARHAYDLLRELGELTAPDSVEHVEVTWLLGTALSQLERFEEAEATLSHALDLEPASAVLACARGENAMYWGDAAHAPAEKMQHYQHAQNLFHRAVAMAGDTAELHYNLACMGSLLGDHDEAVRALRSAIERDATCREDARTDPHLGRLRLLPAVQAMLGEGLPNGA